MAQVRPDLRHQMTPSLLTLLYQEQRKGAPEIARYLGCANGTVRYYLRKYGIACRPRGWHAPRTGTLQSPETKQKISQALCGRPSHRKGKRGIYAQATLEKMRVASISRGCIPPHRRGHEHWNWQGGIHRPNERQQQQVECKRWRLSVYQRDAYTCQGCGQVGRTLNAHHIKPWSTFPECRFVLDNGVTLCVECHRLVHQRQTKR